MERPVTVYKTQYRQLRLCNTEFIKDPSEYAGAKWYGINIDNRPISSTRIDLKAILSTRFIRGYFYFTIFQPTSRLFILTIFLFSWCNYIRGVPIFKCLQPLIFLLLSYSLKLRTSQTNVDIQYRTFGLIPANYMIWNIKAHYHVLINRGICIDILILSWCWTNNLIFAASLKWNFKTLGHLSKYHYWKYA